MRRAVLQISVLTATAFVLVACGMSENKFTKKLAKASCTLATECDESGFDEAYDNLGDCVEDVQRHNEEFMDFYDDCDFQKGHAKDCLTAVSELPCDAEEEDYADFDAACLNVWDCGEIDPGTTGETSEG